MQEYYFSVKKMSVGYQGKPLIRDIDIGIKKGESLTLIGPNGAGKSTILKSIARQLQPLKGAVYLDGRELAAMGRQELAREMAVVFTDKLRAEMMTCKDVAETGRYPYTGKFGILSETDHRIVSEAMKLADIAEIGDQDFDKVSDGQKQRVMLARAICQEPEILILDEPTSFLDLKYKLEFLTLLQELQKKKGLTVIMSLHELELAKKVSDKILCVKGEYIDKFGPPKEIFTQEYLCSLFHISRELWEKDMCRSVIASVCGTE